MAASSSRRWIFSEVTRRFDSDLAAIERRLEEICEGCLSDLGSTVGETVAYGLRSPGKRLRPLLLVLGYRACGGERDSTKLACAPEIIHAYSLMHDDLPCMDDDDVRRGRPTAHKVHGTRATMVAGVAMIPLAVKVARDAADEMRLPQSIKTSMLNTLLTAAGAAGMIGGQLRDLAGERQSLSITQRETIHTAKTASLIAASLRIGGVAAEAEPERANALGQFGASIGLAFQIMDDVLDVTSTTAALGKTTGQDERLGKSSYPGLLGVEGARARAVALIKGGIETLSRRNLLTQELLQVANFMVSRTS